MNGKEQAIIQAACNIIDAMDEIHKGKGKGPGVDLIKLRKTVENYKGKNR